MEKLSFCFKDNGSVILFYNVADGLCSNAISTVISVPLFCLASMTISASDSPLTMRFLGGKYAGMARIPGA